MAGRELGTDRVASSPALPWDGPRSLPLLSTVRRGTTPSLLRAASWFSVPDRSRSSRMRC